MTPERSLLPPNIISLYSPWLPKNRMQGHFSIYCRLFSPEASSNSLRNLLEVSCNIFHYNLSEKSPGVHSGHPHTCSQIHEVCYSQFPSLLFSLPWLVLHSLIRYSSYQYPDLCFLSDWHIDQLVQYIQLVMHGRIPYLNIDQSSWCHDLAKWLSHYLYFFSFLFLFFYLGLTTQKEVQESVTSQVSHKIQSRDRKSQHHIT